MNTKTNNVSYKKNPEFRDFRNHVQVLVYCLDQYAYMAVFDDEDFFTEGCLNQLRHYVKHYAVCLFNNVQQEDDEYGTLGYTGTARTFRQAKEQFLDWLDETYAIRPVYYEGELNSYTIPTQRICETITRIHNFRVEALNGSVEEEEDEDLPF